MSLALGTVLTKDEVISAVASWRKNGQTIVFTNGCFDILHRGHVDYLNRAKQLGDVLIVGINSDRSVQKLKGRGQPFVGQEDRAFILSELKAVDVVSIFDEDTPFNLINAIKPDILVKGGDYKKDEIVGGDIVENNGGRVEVISFVDGKSTTDLIETIRKAEI